jgi:hypothetical protein
MQLAWDQHNKKNARLTVCLLACTPIVELFFGESVWLSFAVAGYCKESAG